MSKYRTKHIQRTHTPTLSMTTITLILAALTSLLPKALSQPPRSPEPPCYDHTDTDFRCEWVGSGSRKQTTRRCRKTVSSSEPSLLYSDYCPKTCKTCNGWSYDTIHVSSFGAMGDSSTDDSFAIQAALDYAYNDGLDSGVVHFGRGVFRTSVALVVRDGVRMVGEGYGGSPLAIDFGGTVIAYCGTDYAIRISGHNAGIERLAVYDWPYSDTNGVADGCSGIDAKGGVVVDAVGRLVESVVVRDVLFYHFMGGTGLTLRAVEKGGVAFSSFYDLRVRHAKLGIHLVAEEGSFVNANSFYGGAVTGAMTESGLLAEGPGPCNGNRFDNMAIEPPDTLNGHVVVRGYKTNVWMSKVRIEGTEQDESTPMIHIYDGSYHNIFDGSIGHQGVRADFNRNPDVHFSSYKGTSIKPTSNNAFHNAAFHAAAISTIDGTTTVPKWKLEEGPGSASLSIAPSSDQIYPNHKVVQITFSPSSSGGHVKFLSTDFDDVPTVHSTCSFGIYARSSTPRAIVATMFSSGGGMVSSTGHSGSGEWEFIGSAGPFQPASEGGPRPVFYVYGDVELSAPFLSYGTVAPAPGFEPLASTGGSMTGTLTMGMVTVPPNGYYWELPHEGNIFEMGSLEGETVTILRINGFTGSKRFPNGTVITVLLPEVGVTFSHGGYLELKGNANFSPTLPNSSITLVNFGSGYGYGPSWREIGRNE